MSFRAQIKEIGEKGHAKIAKATAAIAGVGGVGSVLADILVRDGLAIRLIDKGRIEEQDLPRQGLYLADDIARFKAKQAKKRLELIYTQTKVKAFHEQILENNVYLLKADVVIDCAQDDVITKLIAAQCKRDKSALIVVRTHGLQYQILVCAKVATAKTLEKLKTAKYSEEGISGITTHGAASRAVAEAYKIILGEAKGCYLLTGDAWKGIVKTTKL